MLQKTADTNVSNTYTLLSENLYIFNKKFMKSYKENRPGRSCQVCCNSLTVIPEAFEQGDTHFKKERKKNDRHEEQVKMG